MASFLTPDSMGQSESQAQPRLTRTGEGLHLSLGGAAKNLQPSFLCHRGAQGCCENHVVILSIQQVFI